MPVRKHIPRPHQLKIPDFDPVSHVAVARPVYGKEIAREEKARKAKEPEKPGKPRKPGLKKKDLREKKRKD